MPRPLSSSRQRYRQYLLQLRARLREGDTRGTLTEQGGERRAHRRARSTWELLRNFWALLGAEQRPMSMALSTLTVATLLALVPPAATKGVVDYVLGDQPVPAWVPAWAGSSADRWRLLVVIVAIVVLASAIKTGLHVWGRWHATRATKRVQLTVRKKLFEHCVRLPLKQVYDLKSGGVASLLREDAGSVGDLVFGMLYNPWRAVIQLVGSLCVLAWVDWRLLLGALIVIPTVFVSHRTWIRNIRPRHRDVRARRMEIDAQATEAFGGMRVVRAFSRQRTETNRFMTNNDVMARQELAVWWWSRGIEVLWEIMIPLGSAALLLYGGWAVLSARLTVGDLMMFLAYLLMLLEPLAVLATSATQLQNGLSALDRVLDLLGRPREMQQRPGALRIMAAQVQGQVTFENVTFRYSPDSSFALEGIDLVAEPGQVIALVGPSGAGKTTLCNLVARFYDPVGGRVLLDGRDLRDIEVESFRDLLGLVDQDVFLFDGTVAENIAYADRNASDDEIRRAAEVANAHEFIRRLPQGYDSLIGERGVKLSGGQRQRIAIARAVLADPRILILDEATSNLDTESEQLIQESLATLMQGRTSFVIAHRLSTIRHADRIVVLDEGRIVEQGTHDELMDAGGRYRDMILRQRVGQFDSVWTSGVS